MLVISRFLPVKTNQLAPIENFIIGHGGTSGKTPWVEANKSE